MKGACLYSFKQHFKQQIGTQCRLSTASARLYVKCTYAFRDEKAVERESNVKIFYDREKGSSDILYVSFQHRNLRIIIRFIGLTGESKNIRLLLLSLCYQIADVYNVSVNLSQVTH